MTRKLKFVISDLHLGAGGNHLEDFTADTHLVRFLHQLARESEATDHEVELIINGDMFEFLQVPAVETFDPHRPYPADAYLDASEAASVKRLDLIVNAHRAIFEALADFMHVEPPRRRLTIIKGNHDVNIYWPRVKSRLREVLGASGTRASLLLFADEFIKREALYIEHGHQRAEKLNAYHDFLDPHHPSNPGQLFYPAGSQYVINFFNTVERERWYVDSVKPLTALIWFALRWDFDFAARALAAFIRHTPALVVSNFEVDDEGVSANGWVEQLEDPATRREMARQYTIDPQFREHFHMRVQRYFSDAHVANKPTTGSFPTVKMDRDPMEMGRAEQRDQQHALHRAAEDLSRAEGAQIILFGHSHYPVIETLESGATYINTGCWLWEQDLSSASNETWAALFGHEQYQATLPNRLPYARIEYDARDIPTAHLLDFMTHRDFYDPRT